MFAPGNHDNFIAPPPEKKLTSNMFIPIDDRKLGINPKVPEFPKFVRRKS